MPQDIYIEEYDTTVAFPDEMNDEEITNAITKNIIPQLYLERIGPPDRATSWYDDLYHATGRGWNMLEITGNVIGEKLGLVSTEQMNEWVRMNLLDMQQFAPSEEVEKSLKEIEGAEGPLDALQKIAQNPFATLTVAVQSVISSSPGIAAMLATGGLAAPALVGVSSFATDYSMSILDAAKEEGVNVLVPGALEQFLNDPESRAKAELKAAKRGLAIGVFDAISAGVAGKLGGAIYKGVGTKPAPFKGLPPPGIPASAYSAAQRLPGTIGARMTGAFAAGGAEALGQATLGGAGEAFAQIWDKGGIEKWGDVALEAAAELGPGALETAIGFHRAVRNRPPPRPTPITAAEEPLPEEEPPPPPILALPKPMVAQLPSPETVYGPGWTARAVQEAATVPEPSPTETPLQYAERVIAQGEDAFPPGPYHITQTPEGFRVRSATGKIMGAPASTVEEALQRAEIYTARDRAETYPISPEMLPTSLVALVNRSRQLAGLPNLDAPITVEELRAIGVDKNTLRDTLDHLGSLIREGQFDVNADVEPARIPIGKRRQTHPEEVPGAEDLPSDAEEGRSPPTTSNGLPPVGSTVYLRGTPVQVADHDVQAQRAPVKGRGPQYVVRQDGEEVGLKFSSADAAFKYVREREKYERSRRKLLSKNEKKKQRLPKFEVERADKPQKEWVVARRALNDQGRPIAHSPISLHDSQEAAEREVQRLRGEMPPPAPPEYFGSGGIPIRTVRREGETPRQAQERIMAAGTPTEQPPVEPEPISQSQVQELVAALRRELDRIGLKAVGLRLANKVGVTGEAEGVFRPDELQILIARVNSENVQFDPKDIPGSARTMLSIMDHEMIHALRDIELFLEPEWRSLVQYAKKKKRPDGDTFFEDIQKRYADYNLDAQEEEAVAELFRYWASDARSGKAIVGQPRTLLGRIVKAIGAILRLEPRYVAQSERIMGDILSGRRAGRIETLAEEAKQRRVEKFGEEEFSRRRRRAATRPAPQADELYSKDGQAGKSIPKNILGKEPSERYSRIQRKPFPLSQAQAAQYKRDHGITKPGLTGKAIPSVDLLMRIADLQENARDTTDTAETQAAYEALAQETLAQYKYIGDLQVDAWYGAEEPYLNSAEMIDDVTQNNHLYFYLTETSFGNDSENNPNTLLLAESGLYTRDGRPLLYNDVFRIVHDYFGHTQHAIQFGPVGEFNAFLEHATMYSDKAIPALAAETLAQNSWFNYGPHLRNAQGIVPKQGEPGYVPPSERPFTDQKGYLVPQAILDETFGTVPTEKFSRARPVPKSPEARLDAFVKLPVMEVFDLTSPKIQNQLWDAHYAKSRTTITLMSPDDFISLAAYGYRNRKEPHAFAESFQRGLTLDEIPRLYLYVDENGVGRVDGHEGRHRSRALKERGYGLMPVILDMSPRMERGKHSMWGKHTKIEDRPSILLGELPELNEHEFPDSILFPLKNGDLLLAQAMEEPIRAGTRTIVGISPSPEGLTAMAEKHRAQTLYSMGEPFTSQKPFEDLTPYIQGKATQPVVPYFFEEASEIARENGATSVVNAEGIGMYAGGFEEPSSAFLAIFPELVNDPAQTERDTAFELLAQAQRDVPERAMINVQNANGGGVLSFVVEHVGDITNRMAQNFSFFNGMADTVFDKVNKTLRVLEREYGFAREHEENLRSNAEYRGVSYEEHKAGVDAALQRYADAHRALTTYNEAQKNAKMAAVLIGEQDWTRAVLYLRALKRMIENGTYEEEAAKFTSSSAGYPAISKVAAEMFRVAVRENQQDAFYAIEVPPERLEEPHIRPGLTVFFYSRPNGEGTERKKEEVEAYISQLPIKKIGGFTAFSATGQAGNYRGLQFVWMPEYTDAKVSQLAREKRQVAKDMLAIRSFIQDNKLGTVRITGYEAVLANRDDYAEKIELLENGTADAIGAIWRLGPRESIKARNRRRKEGPPPNSSDLDRGVRESRPQGPRPTGREILQDAAGFVAVEAHLNPWDYSAVTGNPESKAHHMRGRAERLIRIFEEVPVSDFEGAVAAIAGLPHRGWYKRAAKVIVEIFGAADARRFAGLLAALSPQRSVNDNLLHTLEAWAAWVSAGRPDDPQVLRQLLSDTAPKSPLRKQPKSSLLTKLKRLNKEFGYTIRYDEGMSKQELLSKFENIPQETIHLLSLMPAHFTNSVRALTAPTGSELLLSGPKVNSFAHNLVGEVDRITLDTWMATFYGVVQDLFKGDEHVPDFAGKFYGNSPGYAAISAHGRIVVNAAEELTQEAWTAAEVQETIWSFTKALIEAWKSKKENRGMVQLLRDNVLTWERIREVPDFETLLFNEQMKRILYNAGYEKEMERVERATSRGNKRDSRLHRWQSSYVPQGLTIAESSFQEAIESVAARLERGQIAKREEARRKREERLNQDVTPEESAYPEELESRPLSNEEKAFHKFKRAGRLVETYGMFNGLPVKMIEGVHEWDPQKKAWWGLGYAHAVQHEPDIKKQFNVSLDDYIQVMVKWGEMARKGEQSNTELEDQNPGSDEPLQQVAIHFKVPEEIGNGRIVLSRKPDGDYYSVITAYYNSLEAKKAEEIKRQEEFRTGKPRPRSEIIETPLMALQRKKSTGDRESRPSVRGPIYGSTYVNTGGARRGFWADKKGYIDHVLGKMFGAALNRDGTTEDWRDAWKRNGFSTFNQLFNLDKALQEAKGRDNFVPIDGSSAGKAAELTYNLPGAIGTMIHVGPVMWNATKRIFTFSDENGREAVASKDKVVNPRGLLTWVFADLPEEFLTNGAQYEFMLAQRDLKRRQSGKGAIFLMEDAKGNLVPRPASELHHIIREATPEMVEASRRFEQFNNQMVRGWAVQTGLINNEFANILADAMYVPAYRVLDPAQLAKDGILSTDEAHTYVLGPNAQKKIDHPRFFHEALKGGEAEAGNLLDNIFRNYRALVQAGRSNVAAQQVAETLDELKKYNAEEKWGRQVNRREDALMPFTARRNGKDVHYDITDTALWYGLHGLTPQQQDAARKFMSVFSNYLRIGVTSTPSFMMANVWRGKIDAAIKTDMDFKNIARFDKTVRNAAQVLKGSSASWILKAHTGAGEYSYGFNEKDHAKAMARSIRRRDHGLSYYKSFGDSFHALMSGLERVGEASEFAERIVLMDDMMAKGVDQNEAMYQAGNIINFGRHGMYGGPIFQWLSFLVPAVPFLNARLQGLYRLWENQKGNQDKRTAWNLGLGTSIMFRGMLLGMASMALYGLNNFDDDDWKNEPLENKIANDIVYIDGAAIYFPRAFEIGSLFSLLPVMFVDAIAQEDGRDFAKAAISTFFSTLAFNPVPQAIKPVLESYFNYDMFRMREIESMGDRTRLPEDRWRTNTTEAAKLWGDLTGTSPLMADHLVRGYMGSLAMVGLSLFDSILGAAGAVPSKPHGILGDPYSLQGMAATVSGVQRFVRGDDQRTSRGVGDFYNLKRSVDELHLSLKDALVAGDVERARELAAQDPRRLGMRSRLNQLQTRLTEINARIRTIRKNPNLDSDQKTRILRALNVQRNALTESAMKQARAIGL